MPFLFYRFGPYLRRNSKYAPSGPSNGTNDVYECHDKVSQPQESDALEPEYAPDAGEHAHAADSAEKRVAAIV